MSLKTKKCDDGRAVLMFGRPVAKTSLRLEACGTVDELNSFLGLARSALRKQSLKKLVRACQQDLFIVGAELATQARDLGRLEFRLRAERVDWLEQQIARIGGKLKLGKPGFFVPGEDRTSALLDVCRAVSRRAERLAWARRAQQQRGASIGNVRRGRVEFRLPAVTFSAKGLTDGTEGRIHWSWRHSQVAYAARARSPGHKDHRGLRR